MRVPTYDQPSWRGVVPGNPQVYPGWLTPETHPAIGAAVRTYRGVVTPQVEEGTTGRSTARAARLALGLLDRRRRRPGAAAEARGSTCRRASAGLTAGVFHHPAMFGIGPGIEHNTHKIGECVDTRELAPTIAFYARFPSVYRDES